MNLLKKGPEIKLSELKVPGFVSDVYYDAARTAPAAVGRRPARRDRRGADRAQRIARIEWLRRAGRRDIRAPTASSATPDRRRQERPRPARLPQAPRRPARKGSLQAAVHRTRRSAARWRRTAELEEGTGSGESESGAGESTAPGPEPAERRHPGKVNVLLLGDRRAGRAGLHQRQAEQGQADRPPQPAGADDAAEPRARRRPSSSARPRTARRR